MNDKIVVTCGGRKAVAIGTGHLDRIGFYGGRQRSMTWEVGYLSVRLK